MGVEVGKTKTQEAADKIIVALFPLSPDERTDALSLVKETYCQHCGFPQPPEHSCQCWNDE